MRHSGEILESATGRLVLDELLEEITEKLQAGEPVAIKDYSQDYPELESQLSKLLPGMQMLAELGHASSDSESLSHKLTDSAESRRTTPGQLGDFRILQEIGRGGMGVVYEAEQLSIGRRVALKVLPFAAMLDKQQLNRFKNEARAAGTLDHPNIVSVLTVGTERGVHYYAMQLVEGQSLAEVIAVKRNVSSPAPPETGEAYDVQKCRGEGVDPGNEAPSVAQDTAIQNPQSSLDTKPVAALSTVPESNTQEYFRTVAKLGIQAAEALDHAHQNGIVHRDVKPGNLLLDAEGKLYVTDFGLARIEADAGMTMTGDLLGTLAYMSPEQALAKRVVIDHRTDIYSLGVTLYEVITLQKPYEGQDRHELLKKIAFDEPRRLRQVNRQVPEDLETIIAKAMEKNPGDRFSTAQEMAGDLARFLCDQPILATTPNLRQKSAKWVQRNPTLVAATALVSGTLLVFSSLAAILIGNAWDDARTAHVEAVGQRDRYLSERDQALLNLYVADIQLARQEWDDGNLGNCVELLDSHLARDGLPDYRGWEWYYLKSLDHRDVATLEGHTADVNCTAWSPDGQLLASGSSDYTVKIWDATTWRLISTLPGHTSLVTSVAWRPDGTTLASSALDGTVRVWDLSSKKSVLSITEPESPTIRQVVWSPDGSRLATCGESASANGDGAPVRIWDAETGKELLHMQGPSDLVWSIAWSLDGQQLVSTGNYNRPNIKLWDTEPGTLIREMKNGWSTVDVAWHPDSNRFATARVNKIQVWDASNGETLRSWIANPGLLNAIEWSPAGDVLASVGSDGKLRIWDEQGNLKKTLRGHRQGLKSVAWRPDGLLIATTSADDTVKIWNATCEEAVSTVESAPAGHWYPGYDRTLSVVRKSEDGGRVRLELVAGESGDVQQSRPLATPFPSSSTHLEWSPDGERFAIGQARSDYARTVSIIEHATGTVLATCEETCLWQLAWNPVYPYLAMASKSGAVIRNVEPGKQLDVVAIVENDKGVDSVAWSPDGRRLAVSTWKQRVSVYEVDTWRRIVEFDLHPNDYIAKHGGDCMLAWSPDGGLLSAGSARGSVIFWRTSDWREQLNFSASTASILSVAISPDGGRLATSSEDEIVKVWDCATGQHLLTLSTPGEPRLVAWSPDGRCLLGSRGDLHWVWDASAAMESEEENGKNRNKGGR